MKLAVDSSSLSKRYIQETGSNQLDDWLNQASKLGLCIMAVPEIISALNRRLREEAITDSNYRAAKIQLLDDVSDAIVLQLTPAVLAHAVKILENNVLRAMDALHVACAMEWKADLFITSDKRQFDAAVHSGLQSKHLGR